jgi:branched-chain amino acid aminotransferase
VACATSANILIQKDRRWQTPPLEDGALPGIVRGRLIRAGLVTEIRIHVADLETCQAACLTNALVGVRPIHTLNGRVLQAEHRVYEELIEALT